VDYAAGTRHDAGRHKAGPERAAEAEAEAEAAPARQPPRAAPRLHQAPDHQQHRDDALRHGQHQHGEYHQPADVPRQTNLML